MKIVMIKAREGKTADGQTYSYKPGDKLDIKPEHFSLFSEDGSAITASEYEARESVKATSRKSIEDAVVRAKSRNAVAPKDEELLKTSLARFDTGAPADLIVQLIDAQPGKDETILASRMTKSQSDFNGVHAIEISHENPKDAAVKACELRKPMNELMRTGRIQEAVELSRESSVILASEIMPLLKGEGDFRLRDIVRAADTTDANVGTIATGLILMRNFGFLKNILSFMKYITTDFRNEPALYGQPVFTRYITPPAVVAYNTTTGWAAQTPSATDVTVTINKHYGVPINFQNQLLGSTVRNLFSEQLGSQTYALGEQATIDFLTTLFNATWNGTVSSAKIGQDFTMRGVVQLKNLASLSKMPPIGRFCVLHSTPHDNLLKDSNLMTAKAISAVVNKDLSALETAELPPLIGTKFLESQLCLAQSGVLGIPTISPDGDVSFGTNNQIGFLGNMSSMVMAARVPQDYTKVISDIPATAAIEVVTDPDTGLSMLVTKYVDHGLASTTQRVSLMYGFSQGWSKQGIVLTV